MKAKKILTVFFVVTALAGNCQNRDTNTFRKFSGFQFWGEGTEVSYHPNYPYDNLAKGFGLGVGYMYHFNKALALKLSLSYNVDNQKSATYDTLHYITDINAYSGPLNSAYLPYLTNAYYKAENKFISVACGLNFSLLNKHKLYPFGEALIGTSVVTTNDYVENSTTTQHIDIYHADNQDGSQSYRTINVELSAGIKYRIDDMLELSLEPGVSYLDGRSNGQAFLFDVRFAISINVIPSGQKFDHPLGQNIF